jgi:hypothetical protein
MSRGERVECLEERDRRGAVAQSSNEQKRRECLGVGGEKRRSEGECEQKYGAEVTLFGSPSPVASSEPEAAGDATQSERAE